MSFNTIFPSGIGERRDRPRQIFYNVFDGVDTLICRTGRMMELFMSVVEMKGGFEYFSKAEFV